MIIPGIVISILTFPGVIAHELGHKYFCDRFKVRVHEVKYFRLGNPAGYVIHDTPDKFYKTFFIDMGPFIVNTAIAAVLFMVAAIVRSDSGPLAFATGFFAWLGISVAMNAFPSSHDAKVLWGESKSHLSKGNFLAIIGFPFSILIWIANILSFVWFDLVYALALYLLVALAVGSIL